MKVFLWIAAVAAAVFALLVFTAGSIAAAGALHPARRPVASVCPCIAHVTCGDAQVSSSDGVILRAWYYEPDHPNHSAVLVLHGVGGTREDVVAVGGVFLRAGYSVLEPDLRGHGESGGIATYGIEEEDDVHAWANWLLARPGVERLYGFGASLGASELLEGLNKETRFRAVVAESPYSDFRSIANERMRRMLPRGLKWITGAFVDSGLLWARLRYGADLDRASAINAVRHTTVPILLIHGLDDNLTSPENSRAIEAANPPGIKLWLVPNGRHANAWATTGKDFETRVTAWFASH